MTISSEPPLKAASLIGDWRHIVAWLAVGTLLMAIVTVLFLWSQCSPQSGAIEGKQRRQEIQKTTECNATGTYCWPIFADEFWSSEHGSSATKGTPTAKVGEDDWGHHFVCHATLAELGVAIFTLLLCFITGILAYYTYQLFFATKSLAEDANKSSAKALDASTRATDTLFEIERAYLVGGGQVAVAGKTFQIEFSNYGKTPAFIYAFDAEFTTLQEAQAGPQEVFPMFFFEDVVPPGGAGPHPQKEHQIKITDPNADVVYGAFWYEDWQKRVHIFRFILRIVPSVSMYGSTLTSVPGVDRSYMYRD
jgi:hypothetical protein